jgi:hypothetical protein
MKSMSDLMLRAHFIELKEELNRTVRVTDNEADDAVVKVLKNVFNYLKKKAKESSLDDHGAKLYNEIANVLDDLITNKVKIPGKLPMKKAIGNQKKPANRKTGT